MYRLISLFLYKDYILRVVYDLNKDSHLSIDFLHCLKRSGQIVFSYSFSSLELSSSFLHFVIFLPKFYCCITKIKRIRMNKSSKVTDLLCEYCGKSREKFSTNSNYHKHVASRIRNFKCESCERLHS